MANFKLISKYKPAGGQPKAIKNLVSNFKKGNNKQTLLGITGSGKTFVMANVIKELGKPTLVLAHNKTLAAQLYRELKEFFPQNRVEYFISYYDYYQPESYIPTTDTYIEKDASINEEIERMKLKTMSSLMSRDDVIVVASISCIYGAGNPLDFQKLSVELKKGEEIGRDFFISKLIDMMYERDNFNLERGKFKVIGDRIDIIPGYDENIIRLEFFGDELEEIYEIDRLTGDKIASLDKFLLYPAKLFVTDPDKQKKVIEQIKEELNERLKELDLVEAHRLKKKVMYDIEMIETVGYCTGIENYSRYFDGREKGQPPFVLLDYFPKDFLLIIDESHQTLPQARAMYKGDFSRKKNLVDFGFRLPSAFDNRPLKFEEFEKYFRNVLFVSATPGDYEIKNSQNLEELIIRPTGLLDPNVEVRPAIGQVKDLIVEIKKEVDKGNRVLVTTLTKRMAEDLTDFLFKNKIKVRYLHSDIDSLERIELIRQLRVGEFDVLIGINLLREGLDIPEVSLVAILDADKEGFLRDERSLIQTIGRAARNSEGKVIMYADKITVSMRKAIDITKKRRGAQIKYNKEHGIIPKTIIKNVEEKKVEIKSLKHLSKSEIKEEIERLKLEMEKASKELRFEDAIVLRDRIDKLEKEIDKN
jgi:excinuclease ABC subunit B